MVVTGERMFIKIKCVIFDFYARAKLCVALNFMIIKTRRRLRSV